MATVVAAESFRAAFSPADTLVTGVFLLPLVDFLLGDCTVALDTESDFLILVSRGDVDGSSL